MVPMSAAAESAGSMRRDDEPDRGQATGLAGICRALIFAASIRYPDRTITFNAHDEARGSWDAERLRPVVGSLLANALQYGARFAPVELSVIDLDDRVVLAVVNRGEPIPADVRERLFDPFPRGAEPGLHIVKRIVEAHRGSVEVDSDEVRTVFRVTLPKQLEVTAGIQ
jgi:signal transduction histidine kinase